MRYAMRKPTTARSSTGERKVIDMKTHEITLQEQIDYITKYTNLTNEDVLNLTAAQFEKMLESVFAFLKAQNEMKQNAILFKKRA